MLLGPGGTWMPWLRGMLEGARCKVGNGQGPLAFLCRLRIARTSGQQPRRA